MVPPRLGAGRRGQSLYVAPSALQPLLEAQVMAMSRSPRNVAGLDLRSAHAASP